MANSNAPRGFVPVKHINGAAYNGAGNVYVLPQADVNQLNPGDAVKTVAGSDANGLPYITKALGTDTVRGVVIGIAVVNPYAQGIKGTVVDMTTIDAPASKTRDYYVYVMDDPEILCELQDDGLTVLTGTSANKNASFTVANPAGAGQMSASVLSTASVAITAALNLKIIGLIQRDDNAFGVNAKWLVKFNQHELLGNTSGV